MGGSYRDMLKKELIPNYLTYFRIAVIPVVMGAMYLPGILGKLIPFILFFFAGISDYLDGYFARHWNVQSKVGRFLDPIADKLLVVAIILVLVDIRVLHGWHVLPAIAIVCREILVSGLREHLAELRVSVPVSQLAKWKTAVQLLALGGLLLGNYVPESLGGGGIGITLLWISALLTLYTGYAYLRQGVKHF